MEKNRREFLASAGALAAATWLIACGDDNGSPTGDTDRSPGDNVTGGDPGGGDPGSGDPGSGDASAGDPGGGDPAGPDCSENGTTATISSNHGHAITVSREDVVAGVAKVYSIQGSSGHTHDVTVSVANFVTLLSDESITVSSTLGAGHSHTVTVRCV